MGATAEREGSATQGEGAEESKSAAYFARIGEPTASDLRCAAIVQEREVKNLELPKSKIICKCAELKGVEGRACEACTSLEDAIIVFVAEKLPIHCTINLKFIMRIWNSYTAMSSALLQERPESCPKHSLRYPLVTGQAVAKLHLEHEARERPTYFFSILRATHCLAKTWQISRHTRTFHPSESALSAPNATSVHQLSVRDQNANHET